MEGKTSKSKVTPAGTLTQGNLPTGDVGEETMVINPADLLSTLESNSNAEAEDMNTVLINPADLPILADHDSEAADKPSARLSPREELIATPVQASPVHAALADDSGATLVIQPPQAAKLTEDDLHTQAVDTETLSQLSGLRDENQLPQLDVLKEASSEEDYFVDMEFTDGMNEAPAPKKKGNPAMFFVIIGLVILVIVLALERLW